MCPGRQPAAAITVTDVSNLTNLPDPETLRRQTLETKLALETRTANEDYPMPNSCWQRGRPTRSRASRLVAL